MRAFTIFGVGTLARNPEVVTEGSNTYVRFCLVGADNDGPVTSLWFVAHDTIANNLGKARKGDQLIVEAFVRRRSDKDEYVLKGFQWGALSKRK
jgi:hypothetical protein